MQVIEASYLSSTGVDRIRYKKWLPDGTPRGVVQYAHGLCGYIETAKNTLEYLCRQGYIVVANDALGHGPYAEASGKLGYFADSDGWTHVVNDFAALFDMTRAEHPELPYFVFGNSMGSFIVRTFLIRRPENIAGAVLTATSMNSKEVHDGGRKIAYENMERKGGRRGATGKLLAYCFGHYNDRFQPAETDTDWANRDRAKLLATRNDPLTQFFFSIGLYLDMADGQEYNVQSENLKKMNKSTPVLFLSGEADPAGDFGRGPRQALAAFAEAGMTELTLKLYPEARHDILEELNSDEVHQFIGRWIEARIR